MNFIIGVDDFGKVIERQLNFIDKSLFIKEIFDNDDAEVTVITRPRRFGKTLNMSMLQHFLAADVGGRVTKGMFDHLKIAQCGSSYMEQQGKYPVIFMSFKEVKHSAFEDAYGQLRTLIQETYLEHGYLRDSIKLHASDKESYEALANREVTETAILEASLKALSRLLYLHHGVRPWLLIDEYDTPLQSAYLNDHYTQMVEFMRGMFGSALKGNPHVHRAVVTGILRISKESLFSGVNNLKIYSVLNNAYAEHFGFTELEVDEALKQANLDVPADEIKAWYNGYSIGDQQMYNPWSIVNCIDEKGMLMAYWVHTSSYDLIKTSMASASAVTKEQFEKILQGESIEQNIDEHMVFGSLKTNLDAVWSLLLFSGYLTAIETKPVRTRLQCVLKVPNLEIADLYKDIICEWFSDVLGEETYRVFLNSLATGKLDEFLKILKQFLKESCSYFDTTGRHPEKFYHGFVLGLVVGLYDTHRVQSNKESGYGRYDIMLVPKDTQQLGIILEFKVAEENQRLAAAAIDALKQINDRDYETELRQKNILKIVKVGLAFRGKKVEMASDMQQ